MSKNTKQCPTCGRHNGPRDHHADMAEALELQRRNAPPKPEPPPEILALRASVAAQETVAQAADQSWKRALAAARAGTPKRKPGAPPPEIPADLEARAADLQALRDVEYREMVARRKSLARAEGLWHQRLQASAMPPAQSEAELVRERAARWL